MDGKPERTLSHDGVSAIKARLSSRGTRALPRAPGRRTTSRQRPGLIYRRPMTGQPPPRLYGLPATGAPVVAVLRRGPSDWSHVGRWDLARNVYEPGAWLHGKLYPRRSDVSPDGRWLCYFAHDPSADWEHGTTYIAVSRLPWLTALHASGTDGTWTRGYRFTADRRAEGVVVTLPNGYALAPIPTVQFANERDRGWEETPDSPPRHPNDVWDQRRNARLCKHQPRGERILHVESLGAAGGELGVDQAIDGLRVCYALEGGGALDVLDDVQWADWDARGRLLVATRDGRLQVRDLRRANPAIAFEADLAALSPDPKPAPDEARHW